MSVLVVYCVVVQIIGYSDGGAFSANVGPREISREEVGQFQGLVTSTAVPKLEHSGSDGPLEKLPEKKSRFVNCVGMCIGYDGFSVPNFAKLVLALCSGGSFKVS